MQTGNTVVLKPNAETRRPAQLNVVPDRAFEPGTQLDRYLILERLGGGGTGQVYRARDTELDREVALKVLSRPHRRQPELLNRVRAEAQAQARLRSPHVVTLYSLLELPSAAVLILEYVEGETLEKRLRTNGPLSPDEATAIFEQALLGLAHVHEMGVIHRDLKPSNLFLTATGLVKIMDFSVARLVTQDAFPPRTMVGTLLYSAPEQISGRGTDARSDVYAIGMSLYESVTGRLPFEHQTEYALIHAHVQEQPPRPRELAPSLPAGLERVILKSIEKEPDRRYRDAPEFRAALLKHGAPSNRRITVTLPANAYGPVPPPKGRHRSARRFLAGFALDLLLITAACGLVYALATPPEQSSTTPRSTPASKATSVSTPAKPPAASIPKPAREPVQTRRRTPPPPKPRAAKQNGVNDRFKALRKAWGD